MYWPGWAVYSGPSNQADPNVFFFRGLLSHRVVQPSHPRPKWTAEPRRVLLLPSPPLLHSLCRLGFLGRRLGYIWRSGGHGHPIITGCLMPANKPGWGQPARAQSQAHCSLPCQACALLLHCAIMRLRLRLRRRRLPGMSAMLPAVDASTATPHLSHDRWSSPSPGHTSLADDGATTPRTYYIQYTVSTF